MTNPTAPVVASLPRVGPSPASTAEWLCDDCMKEPARKMLCDKCLARSHPSPSPAYIPYPLWGERLYSAAKRMKELGDPDPSLIAACLRDYDDLIKRHHAALADADPTHL